MLLLVQIHSLVPIGILMTIPSFIQYTTIFQDVEIGKNCNIFSNTVLGSDGFGFAPNGKNYEKIYQLGKLLIGNNVEIGAYHAY